MADRGHANLGMGHLHKQQSPAERREDRRRRLQAWGWSFAIFATIVILYGLLH